MVRDSACGVGAPKEGDSKSAFVERATASILPSGLMVSDQTSGYTPSDVSCTPVAASRTTMGMDAVFSRGLSHVIKCVLSGLHAGVLAY